MVAADRLGPSCLARGAIWRSGLTMRYQARGDQGWRAADREAFAVRTQELSGRIRMHLDAHGTLSGSCIDNEGLRLFHKVKDFDCSSLIEGCTMLLSIAESNKPKAQQPGSSSSPAPVS